jgi:hypothetical protein
MQPAPLRISLGFEPQLVTGIPNWTGCLEESFLLGAGGGDPGIGKSTLMMQLASTLRTVTTLYITGGNPSKSGFAQTGRPRPSRTCSCFPIQT